MPHRPSSEATLIALAPCNQLPHKRISILVSREQYDIHRMQWARFHRTLSGQITMRMAGWRRSRLLEDVLQVAPRETSKHTFDFRPDPTSVTPEE